MTEIWLSTNFSLPKDRPVMVVGTDTEVGKTYVTSKLAEELFAMGVRVGVYKPAASGCQIAENFHECGSTPTPSGESMHLISEDALILWEAAGKPETLDAVCPQRFFHPLAPPAAAIAEGKSVDISKMLSCGRWWQERSEVLLIEGAGGILSPLAENFLNIDLAVAMQAEVIVVSADRLGMINHTLLTLAAAEKWGLSVRGVIVNQVTPEQDASARGQAEGANRWPRNREWLEKLSEIPVVATLEHQGGLVYS